MTDYNEEIEFEEVQKAMEENIEESKLHEPTMKEKNSLRKDINKMTHKDRILMVNKILNKQRHFLFIKNPTIMSRRQHKNY